MALAFEERLLKLDDGGLRRYLKSNPTSLPDRTQAAGEQAVEEELPDAQRGLGTGAWAVIIQSAGHTATQPIAQVMRRCNAVSAATHCSHSTYRKPRRLGAFNLKRSALKRSVASSSGTRTSHQRSSCAARRR